MSVGAFRLSVPILSSRAGSSHALIFVRLPNGALFARPSPTPLLYRSSSSSRAKSTASPLHIAAASGRCSSSSSSGRALSKVPRCSHNSHSRQCASIHTSTSLHTSSSPSSSSSSSKLLPPPASSSALLHTSSSSSSVSVSSGSAAAAVATASATSSSLRKTLNVSAQHRALKRQPWMQLIKLDLSALTVVTAAGGYLLAGGSIFAVPSFAGMLVGSSLCASSAAIFNQLREIPYDRVMQRTRNRPLPMGQISESQARAAGYAAALSGTGVLAIAANPAAAAVGAATIFSYVHMYTPMKRMTPLNTEFGAVVGALPPILGWVAATGGTSTMASSSAASAASLLPTSAAALTSSLLPAAALGSCGAEVGWLFATLFAWQMHHFMAITWRFRKDYDRAGFQMISRGDKSGDRTLRKGAFWAASMGLLPPAAVALGIANPMYMVWGTCANLPLWYSYYTFYQKRTKPEARKAMIVGFVQLPLLMAFLVFSLTDREKYTAFRETLEARAFGERMCVYAHAKFRVWLSKQKREMAERQQAAEEARSEQLEDPSSVIR